ncbi:MAG: MBL fold metallo-hydrolase [Bacteroidetes bacterium]|nr:MBL fold metallo-hydrolase [Bacteroidota bacterium]
MQLKVIGSNSHGNGYLLDNGEEALLIECGVNFSRIQKAVDFDISRIAGCLVSHCHGDHAKYAAQVAKSGIKVFSSAGTFGAIGMQVGYNVIKEGDPFSVGGFRVMPFKIVHDVPEPLCFMIKHADCGVVVFLTDTVYSAYRFEGVDHYLIEANYALDIIDQRIADGKLQKFLRDRILNSHMSIDTCIDFLRANDLSSVKNIVLIHLSDGNSDAARFKTQVARATGKPVFVADAGMSIPFGLRPF